jgi:glycolate oxidase FAD binding subunit
MLLGVRVALADGSVIRGGGKVVKNVAGYDLCKLFAGSWGTLGLITEATFKTNPIPARRAHLVFGGLDIEPTIHAALEAHVAQLEPVYMVASLARGESILAVGLHGSEQSVAWQIEALTDCFAARGLRRMETGIGEEGLRHSLVRSPSPVKVRITVRPSDTPAVAGQFSDCEERIVCHVQTGVVELAMELAATAGDREFAQLRSKVNGAVANRGCAVWTAVPTRFKSALDMWGSPTGDHAIMRKLKQALDPGGLFSPGQFLGRL